MDKNISDEILKRIIDNKKDVEKQLGTMSKEEEIGFYKGYLKSLAAERDSLIKRIGDIEEMIKANIKKIRELSS